MTPAQQSAIAADPAVAAVYPDLPITKAPAPDRGKGRRRPAKPTPAPTPRVCPTDPSKPLLEPEALQVTNTAFLDPATPQAQNLVTGAGVKVGVPGRRHGHQQPGLHPGRRSATSSSTTRTSPVTARTRPAVRPRPSVTPARSPRRACTPTTWPTSRPGAPPLPPSCTITIRGMAPGASLVGLKVFGNSNTAPTSRFIQAIDYAVNTAGVDVINESFGGNPFPDNGNDPISLADNAAVDAGVTVVAAPATPAPPTPSAARPAAEKIIGVAGDHDVPVVPAGDRLRRSAVQRHLGQQQHLVAVQRRRHPERAGSRPGRAG